MRIIKKFGWPATDKLMREALKVYEDKGRFDREDMEKLLDILSEYRPSGAICGTNKCLHTCCNLKKNEFVIEVHHNITFLIAENITKEAKNVIRANIKKNTGTCIARGPTGCVLGKYRPIVCYSHWASRKSECNGRCSSYLMNIMFLDIFRKDLISGLYLSQAGHHDKVNLDGFLKELVL